jgi:hypothetical protein
MKKQVYIRVKVDPGIRHAFQLSSWRMSQSPTHRLRALIHNCVAMDQNPWDIDLNVWGDSFPLESEAPKGQGRPRSRS